MLGKLYKLLQLERQKSKKQKKKKTGAQIGHVFGESVSQN